MSPVMLSQGSADERVASGGSGGEREGEDGCTGSGTGSSRSESGTAMPAQRKLRGDSSTGGGSARFDKIQGKADASGADSAKGVDDRALDEAVRELREVARHAAREGRLEECMAVYR